MLSFLLLLCLVNSKKAWIITDTHFDSNYAEGTPTKCYTTDCCHEDSKPRQDAEEAGRCASYECYPPLNTVTSAFDHIRENKDQSDTVFWLMDAVPGDVLSQSKEINKNTIKLIVEQLKQKLPGFKIYPVPGNHDYFLSSNWEYPPKSEWMLSFMADLFSEWLSTEALETFKIAGYYNEMIDTDIRLVALNLVYVDMFSMHNGQYKRQDPGNMVAWFNQTLKDAKANNEKILLISHECIGLKSNGQFDLAPEFNADFTTLMEEYGDLMITHFCGHSHYESFRLLPNRENAKYSCLVNPALTSYKSLDPKFRLIEFDKNGVKDWMTFAMNVEECNNMTNGYPWKKLYRASEYYGINDYSVDGLKQFYDKLSTDSSLWSKFMKVYSTTSFYTCADDCKKGILCALNHLTEEEYKTCMSS
ncbi:sphingomyelin phosphodiesterase, putative [Entamoeba invadens IP1]|uniref:Sphingomyelin phosphodiesterase, putative n=2 Tax=Entamoeba invadens TaxID=33085 RepID=A0A0A1UAF1_ENTIV|nr:sphingomyelin phosphodiesterase, putative [Entamoeba invadens IP1]ELP90161.1 sphingomyelin phosphodiesterase, putative [Entamoeba invadens IP1]BAN40273.1 sphingomyelin phosphodiesterase, putative [Entamoeba invadens]BAN40779.1 sphingomyelin phosphodiesterase, putative [Entamoeba invadens]|eukprot:XP_004256932.1 sphingomyelin phosphodiesterase, putative [Entamoeba invadens IP1]